ncbi:hypothetical protein AJ78_01112, partial [Emergomyces pasteurianus Ep9510]
MAMMSLRMARMDVCKESISKMPPSQIPKFNDPTTFPFVPRQLHKYSNDKPQSEPVESFDRPESSLSPQPCADLLRYRLQATNYTGNVDDGIEMMINTARWLAKARCTESVDLFCDVARMFSPPDPSANLSDEKYSLVRAVCDVMSDVNDVCGEPCSPAEWNANKGSILDTINWEYFVDAAASRRSLMNDLRLRMTAEWPTAPAHMHGHRLSSHGSIRRGRKRKNMRNNRVRSENALPRFLALCHEGPFLMDRSNWAANHTSPFSDIFQEALDHEESTPSQQLKTIYEGWVREHSHAAHSQAAHVRLVQENK